MRLSIWKFRPSPCQTKVLLILCLSVVCCRLLLINNRSGFNVRYNGPQADTSAFFHGAIVDHQSPVGGATLPPQSFNKSELSNIRMQLFPTDEPTSFNLHNFSDSNGILIAIQVHNRPQFFSILIDSLRAAQNIDKVDLIISHDVWSEPMDAITKSIDFCRVHQIYFPLSANFYSDEYPADSSTDCIWNKPRSTQPNTTCNGQEDSYGHFREARIVNIKHHWWWKLNRIKSYFPTYTYLILLEEDHAVTPDFLHITTQLNTFAADQNGKINQNHDRFMTTLGTYKSKLTTVKDDWLTVVSASFDSGRHNMGMILARELVNQLTSEVFMETFCSYDDYNWDFSLYHTILTQMKFIRVFYPLIPRVFHLGDNCGVHHKRGDCSVANVNAFRDQVHQNRFLLFPQSFRHLRRTQELRRKKLKPNGGWGDSRDRSLCRLFQSTVAPSDLLKARTKYL